MNSSKKKATLDENNPIKSAIAKLEAKKTEAMTEVTEVGQVEKPIRREVPSKKKELEWTT